MTASSYPPGKGFRQPLPLSSSDHGPVGSRNQDASTKGRYLFEARSIAGRCTRPTEAVTPKESFGYLRQRFEVAFLMSSSSCNWNISIAARGTASTRRMLRGRSTILPGGDRSHFVPAQFSEEPRLGTHQWGRADAGCATPSKGISHRLGIELPISIDRADRTSSRFSRPSSARPSSRKYSGGKGTFVLCRAW